MKKVFVIDWILIVVFIVSAISGIGLHIAGHGNSHEVWHNWVTTHWGWYKGIIKNGIGRKSKVTAVLSIIFLLLSVTGIVLLGVSGANTPLGLWHYKIGVMTTVIAVGHIVKRLPVLRKSLNTKNSKFPTSNFLL